MSIVESEYDIIFIGVGISTIFFVLNNPDKIKNKKVLFLEKDKEFNQAKTISSFCRKSFLRIKNEFNRFDFKTGNIQITRSSASPYTILDIKKTYEKFLEVTSNANFLWDTSLEKIEKNDLKYQVFFDGGKVSAFELLDSRPPNLKNIKYLKQHFLGLFYRFEENHEVEIPVLMDINSNAEDFHFFYLIPLSQKELLVESTHIGREKIEDNRYKLEIDAYMKKRFKDKAFKQYDWERGIIPMIEIIPSFKEPNYTPLGIRSGALRASTGYSAYQSLVDKKKSRILVFMDKILLRILWRDPKLGNNIFLVFFENLDGETIADFMGPSPKLITLLKVIFAMPKLLFIKEVFRFAPDFDSEFKIGNLND